MIHLATASAPVSGAVARREPTDVGLSWNVYVRTNVLQHFRD